MIGYHEGQAYNGSESKIDERQVEALLLAYDNIRKTEPDFVRARRDAIQTLGIPGDKWEKYFSALSKKIAERQKARGGLTGRRRSGRKTEHSGLSPRLLTDIQATVDVRGGDPDDLDAE